MRLFVCCGRNGVSTPREVLPAARFGRLDVRLSISIHRCVLRKRLQDVKANSIIKGQFKTLGIIFINDSSSLKTHRNFKVWVLLIISIALELLLPEGI